MYDQLADLGSVCVLDAKNLVVGMHVEIDGELLLVTKIIDEHVFLSPVLGFPLWAYHLKKFWRKHKVLICVGLGLVLISITVGVVL